MKKIKKSRKILALGFIAITLLALIPYRASSITKEPEMAIQYTLEYETNSSEFSNSLINLEGTNYFVDDSPTNSKGDINTDYYRLNISDIQSPLYSMTDTNYTSVRVEDIEEPVNDSTYVTQADSFTIPNNQDASWKLTGNMNTTQWQINATSIDTTIGSVSSGSVEGLKEDDSNKVAFDWGYPSTWDRNLHTGGNLYTQYLVDSMPEEYIEDSARTEHFFSDNLRDPDIYEETWSNTLFGIEVDWYGQGETYSYVLAIPIWNDESRIRINRRIHFYESQFAGGYTTAGFKVYFSDMELWLELLNDWDGEGDMPEVPFDLKYEWERTRCVSTIGIGAEGEYTYNVENYVDVDESNIFKPFPYVEGHILIKFESTVDGYGLLHVPRTNDRTTLVWGHQQDQTCEGYINFDDLGNGNQIFSTANISLRLDCVYSSGYIYYLDQTNNLAYLDSFSDETGLYEYEDIPINLENPRLYFRFRQQLFESNGYPFKLEISYVNLTAWYFPLLASLNISHDFGFGDFIEELEMEPIHIEWDGDYNFTFEMLTSSQDFQYWNRDYNTYVESQTLNLTFTMPVKTTCNITWYMEYSLNQLSTPSVYEIECNGEEVIDSALNQGLVEFETFQENLEFTANNEVFGFVEVKSIIKATNSLDFVTKTLIRDSWSLGGIANAHIKEIDIIGVENIAHVYISGVDFGDDTHIEPDWYIWEGATLIVSIIIEEPVYRELGYLNPIPRDSLSQMSIYGTMNQVYFDNMYQDLLTVNLPSEFTINEALLTFNDTTQNTTYWNEDFNDGLWDNNITTKNNESITEITNNQANLTANLTEHQDYLNVEHNFSYDYMRRNNSEDIFKISDNSSESLDNESNLYNFTEGKALTDFSYLSGTGTLTIVNNSAHEEVLNFSQCSDYFYTYDFSSSQDIGWWEFWIYRSGETVSDRISVLTAQDSSNYYYLEFQYDTIQYWCGGSCYEEAEIQQAHFWYHIRIEWNADTFDTYVNDQLVFNDKEEYGSLSTINTIGFWVNNDGATGTDIFIDAFGTMEDSGYNKGDNFNSTQTYVNTTFYQTQDGGIFNTGWLETFSNVTYNDWGLKTQDGRDNVLYDIGADNDGFSSYYWGGSMNTNDNPFIVEMWYYGDVPRKVGTEYHDLFFMLTDNQDPQNYQSLIYINDNYASYYGGVTIPINTWTHFKFKVNPTNIQFWMNDIFVGTHVQKFYDDFTSFTFWMNSAADDFVIHQLGIVGVNGYEEGDNWNLNPIEDDTSFEFDDFDDRFIIGNGTSSYVELSTAQAHSGSKSVHYKSYDDNTPNPELIMNPNYTIPTTWTGWVYLVDDGDGYTHLDMLFDGRYSQTVLEIYFKEINYGRRYIEFGHINNWEYLSSSGNDWDFGSWYQIKLKFYWLNNTYRLEFNNLVGYNDMYLYGVPDDLTRIRLFRGYESGTSGKGSEAYFDDWDWDITNYMNYSYSNPQNEIADVTIDLKLLKSTENSVFMNLNGTNYELTSSGYYSYQLTTKDFEMWFKHRFNYVVLEINVTWTANLGPFINVSQNLTASDQIYLQELVLNFTANSTYNPDHSLENFQQYIHNDQIFNNDNWSNIRRGTYHDFTAIDKNTDGNLWGFFSDYANGNYFGGKYNFPNSSYFSPINDEFWVSWDFCITDNKGTITMDIRDESDSQNILLSFLKDVDGDGDGDFFINGTNSTIEFVLGTEYSIKWHFYNESHSYFYFGEKGTDLTLYNNSGNYYDNHVNFTSGITSMYFRSGYSVKQEELYIDNINVSWNSLAIMKFDSGNITLIKPITQNQTYAHNITELAFHQGWNLSDFDLDSLLIQFIVQGNNSILELDNVSLVDFSLAVKVNGTIVGADEIIEYKPDTNDMIFDITRTINESFDLTIEMNLTWSFNIEGYSETKALSPNPIENPYLINFTSQVYTITHQYDDDVLMALDYDLFDNELGNYASGLTRIEYEFIYEIGISHTFDLKKRELELDFAQLTPNVTIYDDSVDYQIWFESFYNYDYHFFEINPNLEVLSLIPFNESYQPSEIGIEDNTFYFEFPLVEEQVGRANVTINPNFDINIIQTFNNGTNASLNVEIGSDLKVENVMVYLNLSSFDIFMDHWNLTGFDVEITESENQIVNFLLPLVNETNSLELIGWSDTPIANIARYSIQPYQYLTEDLELLYYGYLEFDRYSKSFQVNLNQLGNNYVFDGVHYDDLVLDIDSNGVFFPDGWGSGITSAYVRFESQPINSIIQTNTENQITITINSSLPILEGRYLLHIPNENRRWTITSQNIEWIAYNDTAYLITGLTVNQGITTITINIRVIKPVENLLYALPVIIIVAIVGIVLYARHNNLSWKSLGNSITGFGYNFLVILGIRKKKRSRNP